MSVRAVDEFPEPGENEIVSEPAPPFNITVSPIIVFDDDQVDFLQLLGELSWLYDKAKREEHDVRVGIDLDEAQIRTANIIAEQHGLLVEEAIEHMVLIGLQQATLAMTRPGLSMDEVNRVMMAHSERIVGELKLRRLRGGNGHSDLIRP